MVGERLQVDIKMSIIIMHKINHLYFHSPEAGVDWVVDLCEVDCGRDSCSEDAE